MSKKSKPKRKLRTGNLILVIAVLLAVILAGGWLFYSNSLKSVSSEDKTVLFTVNSGDTAKTVAKQLKEQGLIQNSDTAYIYVKLNSIGSMKAGTYELNRSWDTGKIMEYLSDPNTAVVNAVTVTIVEGDWAKDIAKKIAAVTDVSEDDLLNLWNDKDYLVSLKDRYPFLTDEMFNDNVRIYLEGYLAPDTYQFFYDTDAETVTEKILDQQLIVYDKYKDQIASSGYSIHQIYTLASIVQFESGKPEDMKMIAGVFYNRLNINMALQSSVTVCYAIDRDKEDNWQTCEVNSDYDSPYNTYKYAGFPPGAVENAGSDALDAVLNPTASDYYYFMADVYGDGTVYYAKTLEEHEANVKKYLQ